MDSENRTASVVGRHPRTSQFGRFNHKRDAVQTLGANVDQVVCVMSVRSPYFRARFVDRVAVLAEFYDLPLLVVVSKADLDEAEATRQSVRYGAIGYRTRACSVRDPSSVEAIRTALTGRRSILVGQSGVGKSSFINVVFDQQLQRVGSVSSRYDRGRHTTSVATLLRGPDLELIDTPGIRELDCRHVPTTILPQLFPEIQPYDGHCRLTGCTHRSEPGCAVLQAIADGRLDEERHDSYVRLHDEIEEYARQSV